MLDQCEAMGGGATRVTGNAETGLAALTDGFNGSSFIKTLRLRAN
jgi:hypothetical protein